MSFDINQETLRAAVFKQHYIPAIESIGSIGRYWFGGTRQVAYMLVHLLDEAGMSVILYNVPPRWEFVLYRADGGFNTEEFKKTALQRHELIEQGVVGTDLPV
ncbi:hypothetical protein H8I69_14995 [Serratia fonticola]|uniref:hypothetical protein n=1 Tax=Serratia fonticola TaxID=47917 RepID=UPI0015C612B8|nr:hypothetical protein [Serratia fonticola]MBC3380422.1 hypothetical protein [Serratia fonticola]NYA39621.1 hypothetical protein [Serratia fonticola]